MRNIVNLLLTVNPIAHVTSPECRSILSKHNHPMRCYDLEEHETLWFHINEYDFDML